MAKKDKKGFFQGFKEFISRGNVLDMAVGVIIGGAFGKIVSSMVNDILMPLIAALFGKASFTDLFSIIGPKNAADGTPLNSLGLADARAAAAGVNATIIAWGNFIQVVIDFLIIAFFIYLVVVVVIKGIQKRAEERRLAHKAAEEAAEPEEPAEPVIPEDIKLLTEIRDQLQDLNKGKK